MDSAPRRRSRVSSGTPWEAAVGYSRAVRVGDAIYVSGTTAMREGTLIGHGEPAVQTRQILANLAWALGQAGASLADIVRYRVYVTDIEIWPQVADELVKTFGNIRPANTLVAVSALVDPAMLVEIEADAIVGSAALVSEQPTATQPL